MCGENVVCRIAKVKKCGEKIKQEEEVSLSVPSKQEGKSSLLIFRSKTGFRCTPPEKRRKEREIFQSQKPETQKSPHPKKGLGVNPERQQYTKTFANVVTYLKRFLLSVIFYNEYSNVCNV